MRVSTFAADRTLDYFAAQLNGGALELYDGPMPGDDEALAFQPLLAKHVLETPAFTPSLNVRVTAYGFPNQTVILATGEARWARLVKGSLVVANLTVGLKQADPADDPDVILDRTDLQRGGICRVDQLSLTWPRAC